jgi:hypothetical protein
VSERERVRERKRERERERERESVREIERAEVSRSEVLDPLGLCVMASTAKTDC